MFYTFPGSPHGREINTLLTEVFCQGVDATIKLSEENINLTSRSCMPVAKKRLVEEGSETKQVTDEILRQFAVLTQRAETAEKVQAEQAKVIRRLRAEGAVYGADVIEHGR